ncbi:hypothetical protein FISHEDRAFT_12637, partial [Fistulina hepatica ATCC 64428]
VAYSLSVVSALTINTPTQVIVCQPVLFSWSGGTAPYYLSLNPGGDPSRSIKSFAPTQEESMTYNVDMPVGTTLTAALKDSTGATAYTDKFTVASGPDTSCLSSASATTSTTSSSNT